MVHFRLLSLAAFVVPAVALAQVQNVTPYYAVVTQDRAPIHSSDSERFYRVAEMPSGTVVVVDGEAGGWSRVSYPGGLGAFVRSMDVSVQGETATLSVASRLKAANAAQGYDGSYKALFDAPLPVGTTLKVTETVKDASGTIAGYKIEAPRGARGYTPSRLLRKASETEVGAFRSKPNAWLPEVPAQPGAVTPPNPAATPATNPTTVPGTSPAPTPSPLSTPVPPTTAPSTTEAPVPGEPVMTESPPVATPPESEASPAPERVVGTPERLDETFQQVWRQPILSGEVDELIAEFDRAIAQVGADRPNTKRNLEGRREALRIRQDFRNTLREQEDARAALDASRRQVTRDLEEIARTRYYTIIGQLQPSLVYDGKQLPRMFRVVSVGSAAPRTLGYLRSTEEMNFDGMVGQVIGVVGEAQLDRSLQLNIITPVHVDVLKSAAAGGGGGGSATAPPE